MKNGEKYGRKGENKKDKECIHCERFFDCEGKPENVENCIFLKKEGNNVTLNELRVDCE